MISRPSKRLYSKVILPIAWTKADIPQDQTGRILFSLPGTLSKSKQLKFKVFYNSFKD
jgi:hypothetical protein